MLRISNQVFYWNVANSTFEPLWRGHHSLFVYRVVLVRQKHGCLSRFQLHKRNRVIFQKRFFFRISRPLIVGRYFEKFALKRKRSRGSVVR